MHTGGKSRGGSNCSICQNPWRGGEGSWLSGKIARGRPPISGVIALLLPSGKEFALVGGGGGPIFTKPRPPKTTRGAYRDVIKIDPFGLNNYSLFFPS